MFVKFGSSPLRQIAGKSYRRVGCFIDRPDRAIPYSGKTFGGTAAEKINRCAALATCRGFDTFAVQYGGQCFTGPNARNTYRNMELEVAVIAGSEGLGETTSISLVCDKIKYIIISVDNYSNTNNLYSDQNNSVLGDNNMEPRMKRA